MLTKKSAVHFATLESFVMLDVTSAEKYFFRILPKNNRICLAGGMVYSGSPAIHLSVIFAIFQKNIFPPT